MTYHAQKRQDRRVMGLEDFTDEDIAALEKMKPSPNAGLRLLRIDKYLPAQGRATSSLQCLPKVIQRDHQNDLL